MFGGGFKGTKCKTLLRLAMARIKLLRNKRDIQIKQMRKDIAQLLSTGQEPSARIRVEHIAREQNIMAAYDIIELFCELIIVRLPIIESQKVCPMDLKEAICSLIFASPRCADLPELLQIRSLFASKYGKEFVAAAAELRPECGVNRRIIEKLSVRAPSGQLKLKLLTEIADEHNVSWDPADSEAELMKQPEDLLDGPKKFFGASDAPIPEQQPPPTQLDEPVSSVQRTASILPPASAPAPPAPAPTPAPPTPQPSGPIYSSESEEEQFIPFVGPLPARGVQAVKDSHSSAKGGSSGKHESPTPIRDPYMRAKQGGLMDYEKHDDYGNAAAAAKAAAESADRAVAAARAAAELAKTHPSQRESLSRRVSEDVQSSSSEEDSEDNEDIVEAISSSRMKEGAVQLEKNARFSQTNDTKYHQENSGGFYGSNSEDIHESAFRRSNSEELQEGGFMRHSEEVEPESFSSRNYSEDQPEKDPPRKFDSEDESFWRSGAQDWSQGTSLRPEKGFDSNAVFSNQYDEQESLYRRDSDLFKGSESGESYPSGPTDKESYSSASKLFTSSDSSSNLFKKTSSDEMELRSSDEAPFYDSKQGFATPKFDDEELPYNKPTSLTKDFSFKRDVDNQRSSFDSPRSKPSVNEFWQSSSFSGPSDGGSFSKNHSAFGSEDYQKGKQRSDTYNMDDTHLDDSQGLTRGGSDPLPTGSYSRREDAESHDSQMGSSPIPKSRRTRNSSKGRDSLEGAGGSGGLPLNSGRPPKFFGSENIESASLSDYHSPSELDSPSTHSFDDSPSFPLKSRSSFNNSLPTDYAPPDRTPPSMPPVYAPVYQSPDTFRESSPSVGAGSRSSRSSPSLERRDSPSAPPVHPKLPDYDDIAARFEALRGKRR